MWLACLSFTSCFGDTSGEYEHVAKKKRKPQERLGDHNRRPIKTTMHDLSRRRRRRRANQRARDWVTQQSSDDEATPRDRA